MSDASDPPIRSEREIAEALRLRADPPHVRRLSRGVLIGGVAVASLLIGAAVVLNWSSRTLPRGPDERVGAYGAGTPEGLQALPDDYEAPPKLGPPLPGDLGRPILKAQERADDALKPDGNAANQDEQRAIRSGLFARVETTRDDKAADRESRSAGITGDSVGKAAPPEGRGGETDAISFSHYVLQAGAIIPAALITALNSNLPGPVTAQVTENVYDSPTGRYLLIPQGSRLIGSYDNRVGYGQDRILILWTRLLLPDGRSIPLDNLMGADVAGQSGIEDEVDHHWDRLLFAAGLSTLLGIGAELGANDQSDIARAIRDSAQDTIGRTGNDIVRRQLDTPPTITVRAGFPMRVMVTRDIVIEPIGG